MLANQGVWHRVAPGASRLCSGAPRARGPFARTRPIRRRARFAMDVLEELAAHEAAAGDWPGVVAPARVSLPAAGPWSAEKALEFVPAPLSRALAEAGATAPGVLRGLCDGTSADAEALTSALLPGLAAEEHEQIVEALQWLARIAAPEAASRRRRFAHLESGEILQEVLAGAAAKQARVAHDRAEAEARSSEAAWRPAVRPARFRLRTDARLAAAAGPTARAEAELAERERWKSALVELIQEAGGPVVDATRQATDQVLALGAAAGGRRARTLGKRVCAWRRVRAWCLDLYEVPFPRAVHHLLEYLQARADEPCGLSVLQGVAAVFSFMETCCGYPRGRRLVDEPLCEAYLKELYAGLTGAGTVLPKQAPRYPVALVLALEREVMDADVAVCYRCHAWWHLLAVWASLRFDDHRGLSPSAVEITARGLEAVLERTKTTGPGKRIAALPLVVGHGAFLRQPEWLLTGWRLWQEVAPFVRDYFLVKPAPGLNAAVPVELSYEQASRMSRAVLAGLPRQEDVMPALGEAVVGLFTQHSARCWLASMAALLEVSEADLSYLGRWSPTTSKGYVRTATEVVMRVQATVAERLRSDLAHAGAPTAGEQSAYLEMRRELLKRRYAEAAITDQLDAMQAWTLQLAEGPVPLLATALTSGLAAAGVAEEKVETDEDLEDAAEPEEAPLAAPPTPPVELPCGQGSGPVLPVAVTQEGPPTSGFVVSLSRSDWRRLHRIGGCARHPGVHYLRYELLGNDRPAPEAYDDFCRQCWRVGGPEDDTDEDESETDAEDMEAPLLIEDQEVPLAEGQAVSG